MAEQKNRTLLDMINAMIISFGTSQNLWEEAFLLACYILNRIPSTDREKTLSTLEGTRIQTKLLPSMGVPTEGRNL